jgi:GT2 family glycosyltransferase
MATPKRFAILVLNYNGKHFLERCFQSLLSQDIQDFEVWLIDNNSTDGSREFTEENFPNVRVLNTKGNLAFAGAYNFAHEFFKRKKIAYQFYLFLNNDTWCDSRMLSQLSLAFRDPHVGIATPAILDEQRKISAVGGQFIFATGTTLGYKNGLSYKRLPIATEVFWASGCALAIPQDLFDSLGGFGDFFIYYEDLDLSWRVRNLGLKVVALESTYILHLQGGAKTPSSRQLYLNERNRVWAYWRNLPMFLAVLMLPVLLSARALLLFFMSEGKWSLITAKLQGNYDAVKTLSSQKRYPVSMLSHLKSIRSMKQVRRFSV